MIRILSDSPWAKPAAARARGLAESSRRFHRGDSSPWPGSAQVTVRLESALPVRMALLKAGIAPPEDHGAERTCIAVVEFANGWNGDSLVAGDWRDARAWLGATGAAPIPAAEARLVERGANGFALVFVFPADGDLISPRLLQLPFLKRDLKTLDFLAEIGFFEVERRFSAAALTFHGRREF
ncbi:MAG TPA: hypothetical protein VKV74_00750 [Bryobacteraceae bacterium]|nr:hypothetical protein [Bryobacteraceae bacterium]